MRYRVGCPHALAAILAVGFFVNVDLRLRPDGSGKLLVTYPSHNLMTRETEGNRFASPVSSMTGFILQDGKARVRVRFSDVNRLVEAPELQNSVLGYQADGDGGGLFWGVIRGAQIFPAVSTNSASVEVTFPGPVVEANTGRVAQGTARWEAPVKQLFSWEGIPLVARFSPPRRQLASTTPR
jgi:hypothetical protein